MEENEKHTRRLNEICIGIFEYCGVSAVMPMSMTRFYLFPIRSYQAFLPAYKRSIRHCETRFGVGTAW